MIYFRKNPGVFADPTVDFVFKRIFGTERFKMATIGLLNSIIKDRSIADVEFLNGELTPETAESKKSIIDVLCKDENGNKFIVEMQNTGQFFFRERMVYYASKMISLMDGIKGDPSYNLQSTYVIAFLKFPVEKYLSIPSMGDGYSLHYVTREDALGDKMPSSPEYFFFDLSKFNKSITEAENDTEIWLSLLNESKYLDETPEKIEGLEPYEAYFEASKRARFTKEEALAYELDMFTERDRINTLRESFQEGVAEGIAKGKAEGIAEGIAKGKTEGKAEVVRAMKDNGLSIEMIAKCTGLTEETISSL